MHNASQRYRYRSSYTPDTYISSTCRCSRYVNRCCRISSTALWFTPGGFNRCVSYRRSGFNRVIEVKLVGLIGRG
jgi:hypothetical protein